MADLILKMDYDITEAQAKQNRLNREFEHSQKQANLLKDKIKNTTEALEAEKRQQAAITDELQEQVKEASKLERQLEYMKSGNASVQEMADFGSINEAETKLKELEKSIKANEQLQNKSYEANKRIAEELKKQQLTLDKQNAKTADIGDKILLNSKKQNKFAKAFERSEKSAGRFSKRLTSLISSALFFSVVTKAFTALRQEFGKMITEAGTKTAQLVSKLNANLAVLGRTLYEGAKPYIEWLLQKLVQMTQVITVGIAKMLGKSVEEMKNLTKSTKEAGEEAKKATAGFDTLQTVDTSSEQNNSSSSDMDFDALNGKITKEMSILTAIVSGAALVLGVILAFTGVNIPLGIGLIAIGAIGLATSIAANWDTMEQETRDSISGVMAIGGALFILLGLALLLTGASIPLGIGLILLGATLLYASYATSPGDSFTEKIKNLWQNVKTITQKFLNWWKSNVIDKTFGAGMSGAIQDMFDNFTELFENIINFFVGVFTGDWELAWKSLVNIVINIINLIISNINSTIQFFLGGGAKLINSLGKAFGKDWSLNADWAKIPTIPRLATGAVIPGGSPFLAMLGDQPRGKTNIEAPLDTLVEAFKLAQGSLNFTIEATGSMSQLIRMLRLKIKQEDTRASVF